MVFKFDPPLLISKTRANMIKSSRKERLPCWPESAQSRHTVRESVALSS